MTANELRRRANDNFQRAQTLRSTDAAEADRLEASAEWDLNEADRLDNSERDANRTDVERRARRDRLAGALGRPDNERRDDFGVPQERREREARAARLSGYSILRAARGMAGWGGARFDGIEAEEHQELRNQNRDREVSGFYLPWDLPLDLPAARRGAEALGIERRDLDTVSASGAMQNLTRTTVIEYLRSRILLRRLGARLMTGLAGTVDIPKQTGTTTTYWLGESGAPLKSNATIGQVQLAPKTVGAYTELTRRAVLQTSVDMEMFARMDLIDRLAVEIDRAGFNGDPALDEPEGIMRRPGVAAVPIAANGGAPEWSHIVQLETGVLASDALVDVDTSAYVATPAAMGKLKRTEVTAGSGRLVWEYQPFPGAGMVNGYPAWATNRLPSNLTKGTGGDLSAILFGDFSQVLLGFWSDIEVLVNPFALDTSGGLRITALADCDFELRHEASFRKIVDAVTT